MATLVRTRNTLRTVHKTLPKGVVDLAYLVDVDADGVESLIVYFVVSRQDLFDSARKRAFEENVRKAVAATGWERIYFRWRTAAEDAEERRISTKSGMLDQPHSAVR